VNLFDPVYLLFLGLVVALFALAARGRARVPIGFLLTANAVFYATWNPIYLLPLAATATTDYWVGRLMARSESPARRQALLVLSLAINLTLLSSVKCWDLLAAAWMQLGAPTAGVRLLFITGISFYTFQSLSYVIDVYRRMQEPATSFVEYAAFVSFFPTLLAGPITRAETLLPQLAAPARVMNAQLANRGLLLIALGFVKKCLIADTLAAQLADRVFEQPLFYSSAELAAGLYAYAIQIYCDFAGYSDIAIGSALLLGFKLKDNFRLPYRAATLAEFWQRWHISFSTWLRDYVFFSLPGNRRGRLAPFFNIVVTFVVGGLWHGVAWGFVIWGGIHGLGLALERWLEPAQRARAAAPSRWRRLWRTALTFHVVLVAWVFFRAESLATVGQIARRLGDLTTGTANIPPVVALLVLVVLALQWLPERWAEQAQARFAASPAVLQAVLLLAAAAVVRVVAGQAIAPFIYQGF
jgi:alginate O-acetyltransferase complex protein AlgI